MNYACCFIGHREIEETEELKCKLFYVIETLIAEKNVDVFFFGSKSEFNNLCYDAVDDLKEKISPHNTNLCESWISIYK